MSYLRWFSITLLPFILTSCTGDRLAHHILALEREAYLVNKCTHANTVQTIKLTVDTELDTSVQGTAPPPVNIQPVLTVKRTRTVEITIVDQESSAQIDHSDSDEAKAALFAFDDSVCQVLVPHKKSWRWPWEKEKLAKEEKPANQGK